MKTTSSDVEVRPGVRVSARFIPVPTTISPEAQRVLAQPNPYGGDTEPDASDLSAWEKRSREGNEAFSAMLAVRFASSEPRKLMEHALSHATLYEIEPTTFSDTDAAKVILYVHGGGFTLGGGVGAAYAAFEIAKLAGLRTFSID